jgi:hypothetical protein
MGTKAQKKKKVLTDKRGEFRFETYFVNGKQKRRKVRLIEGIPVEEFIEMNADEIFLVQEGYYEILDARQSRDKPNADSGIPREFNL